MTSTADSGRSSAPAPLFGLHGHTSPLRAVSGTLPGGSGTRTAARLVLCVLKLSHPFRSLVTVAGALAGPQPASMAGTELCALSRREVSSK